MRPPQLLSVRLGDPPAPWEAAGFAVAYPHDGPPTVVLGRTVVELTGRGDGVEGWAVDGVDHDVDGIPAVPAPRSTADAGPHANGVVRLDHVVVTTDDGGRTVTALTAAGLEVRGERHGQAFGAPVHQQFLWAGDTIVEVVAPEPATATAGGAGDVGTARLFGLAVVTPDLDATCEILGERIGAPREAVQPGRRVATLRHRDLGLSVPVLVMTPHVRGEVR